MWQPERDGKDDLLRAYPLILKYLEERDKRGAYLWDDVLSDLALINPLSEDGVELGFG